MRLSDFSSQGHVAEIAPRTSSGRVAAPDERVEAEWDADADLRDEFGSLSVYRAYRRAEAAAKVRIIGQRAR